jgi:hypothetical protein
MQFTNDNHDCQEWINSTSTCPGKFLDFEIFCKKAQFITYNLTTKSYLYIILDIPICSLHKSCSTCASTEACAWCSSSSTCVPQYDTIASFDCLGAVFDLPSCPTTFAPTTTFQGNLLLRNLPNSSVGGNLHIEGPCSDDGCNPRGIFNFTIDGNSMMMNSAGFISLQAADSDRPNNEGSNILLKSGDGTNPVGGSGGEVAIVGGNSYGGKLIIVSGYNSLQICY